MLKDKLVRFLELFKVREGLEEEFEEILKEVSITENVDLDILRKLINMDDLMEAIASNSLHLFTEEELDAAIAFFSSAVGKSMQDKLDEFAEGANAVAIAYLEKSINNFLVSEKDDDQGDQGSGAGGYTN